MKNRPQVLQPRRVPREARRPARDERDDTQYVSAVGRALRILDAFRPGEEPLGNAQLAERTGLTKPTVSRLAYTLAHAGYLTYDPKRREYELGGAALALGAVAMSRRNIRNLARPLMRTLADDGAFNVGLGTRDRHMMIYTDTCEGKGLVGVRLYAGSRIPILTTAMGRAYLSGLQPAERDALLTELRPQFGAEWPRVIKAAESAIRSVEVHGFCMSAGDWQKDIHGVAAPIRASSDGRVFAMNLGGPAYLLPVQEMQSVLGPRIAEVARKIEATAARSRRGAA